MLRERQRVYTRILAGVFAGGLALLLGLFAWGSFAQSASLVATPTAPRQNETVTLIGSGFAPGETVSVWITYPDFTVYGVAAIVANADGSFDFPYLPDFLGATFTPTGRYTYTAFGNSSGREVYASIDVAIGAAPAASPAVTLTAEPSPGTQGSSFVFRGSGYGAGEPVAIWLRYPDNSVADLGQISAGPAGQLEYVLAMGGAPVGRYALTARGLSSGGNGIAEFDLQVADLTEAAGEASLTVSPMPDATQRSYAIFSGTGYEPGETVTIWVTLPDYSTLWIGDVRADAAGAFGASLYLSEQEPVGLRTYTAYGNTSARRAVTDYTLQPGGGPETTPTVVEPVADGFCGGAGCL